MARSLPDNLEFDQSLDKIARTDGTVNGASVDTGQDHFQRMAAVDLGVWTDGEAKWTFQSRQLPADPWVTLPLEKLDDRDGALGSGGDDNAVVVNDATENNTIILIGLLAIEQFVRAVNITTGSSSGAIGGVNITSGAKRFAGQDGQPMAVAGAVRQKPVI